MDIDLSLKLNESPQDPQDSPQVVGESSPQANKGEDDHDSPSLSSKNSKTEEVQHAMFILDLMIIAQVLIFLLLWVNYWHGLLWVLIIFMFKKKKDNSAANGNETYERGEQGVKGGCRAHHERFLRSADEACCIYPAKRPEKSNYSIFYFLYNQFY